MEGCRESRRIGKRQGVNLCAKFVTLPCWQGAASLGQPLLEEVDNRVLVPTVNPNGVEIFAVLVLQLDRWRSSTGVSCLECGEIRRLGVNKVLDVRISPHLSRADVENRGGCLDGARRVVHVLRAARSAVLGEASVLDDFLQPAQVQATQATARVVSRRTVGRAGRREQAGTPMCGYRGGRTCRTWSTQESL